MRAGFDEGVEMLARVADRVGIGDADAVEAERARFARKRGFQVKDGMLRHCDACERAATKQSSFAWRSDRFASLAMTIEASQKSRST